MGPEFWTRGGKGGVGLGGGCAVCPFSGKSF